MVARRFVVGPTSEWVFLTNSRGEVLGLSGDSSTWSSSGGTAEARHAGRTRRLTVPLLAISDCYGQLKPGLRPRARRQLCLACPKCGRRVPCWGLSVGLASVLTVSFDAVGRLRSRRCRTLLRPIRVAAGQWHSVRTSGTPDPTYLFDGIHSDLPRIDPRRRVGDRLGGLANFENCTQRDDTAGFKSTNKRSKAGVFL